MRCFPLGVDNTDQVLHGNLNIAFPTDIKQQDNFMLNLDTYGCSRMADAAETFCKVCVPPEEYIFRK